MYSYLIPLINKKPGKIVLHGSKNDPTIHNSSIIVKDILDLKSLIQEKLPKLNIYRTDSDEYLKIIEEHSVKNRNLT